MPQLPTIYPNTPQIPLVVQLYDGNGYHGVSATLVEDDHDLRDIQFYRKASAIGIHRGPDSNAITTYVPTVTFRSEKDGFSSFAKALIRT